MSHEEQSIKWTEADIMSDLARWAGIDILRHLSGNLTAELPGEKVEQVLMQKELSEYTSIEGSEQ